MGGDNHYPQIVRAILARPWAIDPDSLAWASIMEVLALRSVGQLFSDEQIAARIAAANNGPRAGGSRQRNVAVIPIYGVISPRQSMMAATSGGTSAASVAADFRAAMKDPEVDGIVFDVDSPGGSVEGVDELAAEIQAARGVKPVAAHANHMAASAAYWAIAGADEIAVSPSGMVGSIGIFTAHDDMTEAQAKLGVKRSVISAGKYKAEGALGQPLSEEAVAHLQEQVDTFYGMFTSRVARGRGVPVEAVRNGYGQGRGVLAKRALELGMVDRVGSLEDTIRRVARGSVGSSPKVALDRMSVWGETEEDARVALGTGLPFAERLELVTAEAQALADHARSRAEHRAEDGRPLSEATRAGLAQLSGSLAVLAADPEPEPVPDPPEARRRVDLELLEAAFAGGYRLPE
ncbi:MAG TPA: S49 family peptidase [Actinomycetota bacterium]